MPAKVRYTKKVGSAIVQAIADGRTISDVSKETGMPSEKTIYKWLNPQDGIPEFRAMYMQALTDKCLSVMDELDKLTRPESTPTIEQVQAEHPTLSDSQIKTQLGARLQVRKMRIDVLKTILTKLSAKLVPELGDKVLPNSNKVDINVNSSGQTQIVLLDYKTGEQQSLPNSTIGRTIDVDSEEK